MVRNEFYIERSFCEGGNEEKVRSRSVGSYVLECLLFAPAGRPYTLSSVANPLFQQRSQAFWLREGLTHTHQRSEEESELRLVFRLDSFLQGLRSSTETLASLEVAYSSWFLLLPGSGSLFLPSSF